MAVSVQVFDSATANMQALAAHMNPKESGPVAGRAVNNAIRKHLFARNATHPNSLGGKRTNFWSQAARSTSYQPTDDGAVVTISLLGFRLQYEGGVIRPVNTKYLAIPVIAEAHGMRPREFDDLDFAIVPGYGPALVRALSQKIRIGKKGVRGGDIQGGEIVFRLAKRATVSAHPEALPAGDEMRRAAVEALSSFYQRAADRGTRGNN